MRVGLLPRDLASPSSRVRLLQYRPALGAVGVVTRVLPWEVRSRADVARYGAAALRLARWADVLVLQKPAQPPALLRSMARINGNLVVDVDDAVWIAGGSLETSAGSYAERFAEAVRLARVVVTGSQHLADEVVRFGPTSRPEVIRPSVVGAAWGLGAPAAVETMAEEGSGTATATAGGPPVLGWVGSPQNIRDFRPEVLAALRRLRADDRVRVRVVSTLDPEWPGVAAEVVPWSVAGEVAAVRSFDVGLMPLGDDPRSRGRCGYKGIQCLAAGVPVIASPVGSGPEIVGADERGLLAEGEQGWVDAIEGLLASPGRRAELGAIGRRWVSAEATVESTVGHWLKVLTGATG